MFYVWSISSFSLGQLPQLQPLPTSCLLAVCKATRLLSLGVGERKPWGYSATVKTLVCYQQRSVGNTKHSTIWVARMKVNSSPARPSTTVDIVTDLYLLGCHCISKFDESFSHASFKTFKTFRIDVHSSDICLTHFHVSAFVRLFGVSVYIGIHPWKVYTSAPST